MIFSLPSLLDIAEGKVLFNRLLAFLKRDFLIEVSYRLSFVLQFCSIFFSIILFYFISRLVSDAPPVRQSIIDYGGQYFSFVLIGIAFQNYLSAGLGSFSGSIRTEQVMGTLEAILATPTRLPVIVLAAAQWSFVFTTFRVAIYLVLGVLLFGVSLAGANIPAALAALLLTIAAFSSLGIISASLVMIFKKGDPFSWAINASSTLLGGVYFPITILPGWLQPVSYLFPITYSLKALRLSLLQGAGLTQIFPDLAALIIFTMTTLPLSLLAFRRAVKKARREGSLSFY